jgi:hypothetical protein
MLQSKPAAVGRKQRRLLMRAPPPRCTLKSRRSWSPTPARSVASFGVSRELKVESRAVTGKAVATFAYTAAGAEADAVRQQDAGTQIAKRQVV